MVGSGREHTIIEVTAEGLVAVAADVSLGRVEVSRVHAAAMPEGVSREDFGAVGTWVKSELSRAEMSGARAVVVVPRGDVVLKTLSLPRPQDGEGREGELAGMVRLQMSRQLTMSADGAAIDYTVLGERAGTDGTTQAEVMAGALTGERLGWWRGMAAAAGLGVKRIVPRCMGVGAMIAELSERREGAVVGVGIGAGVTDIVVAEGGKVVLARAVDMRRPNENAEDSEFADRVVMEVRRTWTARQGGKTGSAIEGVAVIGGGRLREGVAAKVGEAMGLRGEVLRAPPMVILPNELGGASRADVEVLTGLLLEVVRERVSLDFANPRKPADKGAKRRQLVMAGAMGLIVLGGLGYVGADLSLGGLRDDLAAVTDREKKLIADVEEFHREHARVSHLEHWKAARVDWVQHVGFLSDGMPDPRVATLDELTARGVGDVTFVPKNAYPGGTWGERRGATFELSGKVEARQVTSEWRDGLLSSGLYEVQTRGADTPNRFSLSLITAAAAPKTPEKKPATGTNGGKP